MYPSHSGTTATITFFLSQFQNISHEKLIDKSVSTVKSNKIVLKRSKY